VKIRVIHAPGVHVEVIVESDIYAPREYIYFVPQDMTFEKMAKTAYQTEKEMNEWIRRYDNVLRGLIYWRSKFMESTNYQSSQAAGEMK